MYKPLRKLMLLAGFGLLANSVSGQKVFTHWDFNAGNDNQPSSGTNVPSFGQGSLVNLGGTTNSYATGNANDPNGTDNSGYNVTTFATQGTLSDERGVQFNIPTVGKTNVKFSWYQRHSNTASAFVKLLYTLDGTNYMQFTGTGTQNKGLYYASAGDQWYSRMADFSDIRGADNNPNFAVRIVATFDTATNNSYRAASTTSNYSTGGTWRFDLVNVEYNFSLQILHASDHEAGLEAVSDAVGFGAVIDRLEDQWKYNVNLASGDLFIPSPFLSASEDPALTSPLRSTASSYYKGTTSGLRGAIGRADIAIMNILGIRASVLGNHEFDLGTSELNGMIGVDIRSNGADKRWVGAQFPYLSANLDFSGDVNLSYLFRGNVLPDTAFRTAANITANAQKAGLAPFTVIYIGGERIGVVGVTTPILRSISSPGATNIKNPGAGTNNMTDLAAVIQPSIDSLTNRGINKIVLLSHLQQLNLEEQLTPLLRGVDIVIAGGSHTVAADGGDALRPGDVRQREYPILTNNGDNRPAVILQAGANYRYVNRYVAHWDTAGILITNMNDSNISGAYRTDSTGIVNVWGTYSAAFTPGSKATLIKALTDSIGSVINRKEGNIFGKTDVFLEGRRDFTRTQETNLGNISADANLAIARLVNPNVKASIKNGGGIRSAIGEVYAVGSTVDLLPPAPNFAAGKVRGDISQLDIENSLRFNNLLSTVDLSAADMELILEHGFGDSGPGKTPGRFPQISGMRIAWDVNRPIGDRIRSAVFVDTLGRTTDTLIKDFMVYGNPAKLYTIVTLNFLAGGGDGYPFNTLGENRVDIDTTKAIAATANRARFQKAGSEQDAFAEYINARFRTTAYNEAETPENLDRRIQSISNGGDRIFPLGDFNLISPSDFARVVVKAGDPTMINITWNRSQGAAFYRFVADFPGGTFEAPIASFPSNNSGQDTVLSLPSSAVDGLVAAFGFLPGDSAYLDWTVRAYNANGDSIQAKQIYTLQLVRYATLGAFALTAPANNTLVTTIAGSTTPVNITWQASTTAKTYEFLLDAVGGNFSTPLFSSPSNSSGTAPALTLTLGALDAVLASLGLAEGDSTIAIWTVRARNNFETRLANAPFNIVLKRDETIGLNDTRLGVVDFAMYPNPTTGQVNVQITATTGTIEIVSLNGQVISTAPIRNGLNTLDVSNLKAGMYLVRANTNNGVGVQKLIKK